MLTGLLHRVLQFSKILGYDVHVARKCLEVGRVGLVFVIEVIYVLVLEGVYKISRLYDYGCFDLYPFPIVESVCLVVKV